MTHSRFWLIALITVCASPLKAEGWGEPHLSIIPRTAAEAAKVAEVTQPATTFDTAERFERRTAGAATQMDDQSSTAFYHASTNLPDAKRMDYVLGSALFEKLWVTPPSATLSSDGLGPLFNARACSICHPRNGRGAPPVQGDLGAGSTFLRVSVPDSASTLTADILEFLPNAPDPVYGHQIQDKAVPGLRAEGKLAATYETVTVQMGDGSTVDLRKPTYALADPGYGDLHPDAMLSPRTAQQMIGLGLLESIPEADILALADPDDADGNGISGRANRVWSQPFGQWMLGRFGHKAGSPTVQGQSMDALNGDIGLSNPYRPAATGDCTALQTDCMAAPNGNSAQQENLEVATVTMDLLTYFARNVAVPARRDVAAPEVLKGKALFYDSGCAACHQPKLVTHRLTDRPAQSFQLVWPYSDLLLHDMGEGLADHRPEWRANGREWRTAPLWGIGLTETVSGHSFFLHDGRARTLLEAILWHGGEAEPAKEAVRMMPTQDRNALITFLESL